MNKESDYGNIHAYFKNSNHYLDLLNKDLSNSVKFENSDSTITNKLGFMFKNSSIGKVRSEIGHYQNDNSIFLKLEYLTEYKIDFCDMFFTSH